MDGRTRELIERYLDLRLKGHEWAELEQRLVDPDAAEAFAQATRLDAGLEALLCESAAATDVTRLFRHVEDVRETPTGPRRRRAVPSWKVAAAYAAAVVLLAVGVWLFVRRGTDPEKEVIARKPHTVLSGEVYADGATRQSFADGATIEVSDAGPATIRLSDGSEAGFAAASRAVFHGSTDGKRQVVELVEGGGTFRVTKQKDLEDLFEVKTIIGCVTVLGTEFTVQILDSEYSETLNSTEKGEEDMKAKTALMAVVVLSGMVQVDVAGKKYTLTGGDGQVFGEEGERKGTVVTGHVKAVDAKRGTITLAGRRREGKAVEPDRTYQMAWFGTVLINGWAGNLAHVRLGTPVRLAVLPDGRTVANVIVGAQGKEGGGERRREGEGERRREGDQRREGEGERRIGGEGERRREGEEERRIGGEGERRREGEGERRIGGEGERRREGEGERRIGGEGERRREGEGERRIGGEGERRREGEGERKFFRPPVSRGEGGEEGKPRLHTVTGELSQIGRGQFTIVRRGDRGASSTTFAVDRQTQVLVQTNQYEVVGRGEGGREIKRPKLAAAKQTDVKTGRRVEVTATADGRATRIVFLRLPPPRTEGEGEREFFRTPTPRREGEGERRREGEGERRREGEGKRRTGDG